MPLKTTKTNIISEEDRVFIFSDIETILTLNQTFLNQLEERMIKFGPKTIIADILLSFLPHFKMYTQYCYNYNSALELVKRLSSENSRFRAFLKKTEAKTMKKFCDFLILPVQRIPRYVMLIEVLIKYTPDSHPDYENLVKALKEAQIAARALNQKLEESENRAKVVSIRKRFDEYLDDCLNETLVQPHRVFHLEGVLEVNNVKTFDDESEDDEQEPEEQGKYYCFLFNDILLVGQCLGSGKDKYLTYDTSFELNTSFVKDDPSNPNSFQFVNPRCTYVFVASSVEVKKKWVENVEKCVAILTSTNNNIAQSRQQVQLTFNTEKGEWEAEIVHTQKTMEPTDYRELVLDYTQQALTEFLAENHQKLMKKKVVSPSSLSKPKSVLKRMKETLTTPNKRKYVSSKLDLENVSNSPMVFNRSSVNYKKELKVIHEESDGATCLSRQLQFLQQQLDEVRSARNTPLKPKAKKRTESVEHVATPMVKAKSKKRMSKPRSNTLFT